MAGRGRLIGEMVTGISLVPYFGLSLGLLWLVLLWTAGHIGDCYFYAYETVNIIVGSCLAHAVGNQNAFTSSRKLPARAQRLIATC